MAAMSRKESPGNEPLPPHDPPHFDFGYGDGVRWGGSPEEWFCAGLVAALGLILFGAAAALSVVIYLRW